MESKLNKLIELQKFNSLPAGSAIESKLRESQHLGRMSGVARGSH